MSTREVEVYRCWDDRTWDTECVEIPADTPEEKIEEVARRLALEGLRQSAELPVIVGVYNVPEVEVE